MKRKRIIGIVLFIIGVVLIIYSIHSMNRISAAKGEVNAFKSAFSGNSTGKALGNVMEGKASQYDTIVMVMLIGGIVLAVVGGGVVFMSRKK